MAIVPKNKNGNKPSELMRDFKCGITENVII
jgi:hypothetical protein